MQSPLIIGFLSIIPGLGFFVLGQPRRGFSVIGIILGLMIVLLFIPVIFLIQLSLYTLIVVWVGQIYYAVQTANVYKRQKSGDLIAPREIMPIGSLPSDLSANERLAYKTNEIVRQQLNPGERLVTSIFAKTTPTYGSHMLLGIYSFFTIKYFHVGLTENSLLLIEQDFFGKPMDIKRISKTTIKSCKFSKGLTIDQLKLEIVDKKPLNLTISFRLRKQTMEISKALQY
jgi:hypothetical protein